MKDQVNEWTPGPWKVTAISFEGCDKGEVAYWLVMSEPVASAANARLIETAPDLYEALEALLEMGHVKAADLARAALAKARGAQ